jgi:hypothetical protein
VSVATAHAVLKAHMARYPGELLTQGTFASEEFSRLYEIWICARWDAGDLWVRGVWKARPK